MDDSLLRVFVRRLSSDGRPEGKAGLAALRLEGHILVISPDIDAAAGLRPLRLPMSELAGLAVGTHTSAPEALILHPLRGEAIAIQPRDAEDLDALLSIGRRAERGAFELPEFTRGLRAVGARRGAPGDEHDRWFAALLSARQAAARADDWTTQLKAFAPQLVRRQLSESMVALVRARYPASPPDQRALEAALEEYAAAYGNALETMESAAERVRAASADRRLVEWRAWVDATRGCFIAADRAWLAMAPLLARHAIAPSAAGSFRRGAGWWRRRGVDEQAS